MMPRDVVPHAISLGIDRLLAERATHASALNQIDGVLSNIMRLVGASSGSPATEPVRTILLKAAALSPTKKRRGPGTYAMTAVEIVRAFVQGRPQATTAEVNAHWKQVGRNGTADNTLTALVKAGRLRRTHINGKRGAIYSLK